MGCDAHSTVERRTPTGWEPVAWPEDDDCFGWRNYSIYGFLAGVRNYSGVTPIAAGRGLPHDATEATREAKDRWNGDAHSTTWLSLRELMEFDYEAEMEDRRVTRQISPNYFDGGCTCEPGQGNAMTWREFLSPVFFADLATLATLGAPDDIRVVLWFNN